MAKTKADPLIGQTFRGYRIVSKIASGGMGAVYVGVQESLGRKVALKILYQELDRDPTNIRRFHREALAAAKLTHPNIVAVHDVFEERGRHVLVMEYVEGESVLATLHREGRLGLTRSVRILLQTAAALHVAHKSGIIHRDIKPGNLLLDANGFVKVVDFGIVKMTADDANLTMTGFIVGTPHYISPEQAIDGETGPRSDIYSLGATFYEMITGQRAFGGRSAPDIIQRHIEDPLIPPRKVNEKIPDWLSKVVCKMMAKRPERRFRSCLELIEEIKRQLKASRGVRPSRSARPQHDARSGSPPAASLAKVKPSVPATGGTPKDHIEVMLAEILDHTDGEMLLDRLIDDEIHKSDRLGRKGPAAEVHPPPKETEAGGPAPELFVVEAEPNQAPFRGFGALHLAIFILVIGGCLAGAFMWEDILRWSRTWIPGGPAASSPDEERGAANPPAAEPKGPPARSRAAVPAQDPDRRQELAERPPSQPGG